MLNNILSSIEMFPCNKLHIYKGTPSVCFTTGLLTSEYLIRAKFECLSYNFWLIDYIVYLSLNVLTRSMERRTIDYVPLHEKNVVCY